MLLMVDGIAVGAGIPKAVSVNGVAGDAHMGNCGGTNVGGNTANGANAKLEVCNDVGSDVSC